MMKSRILKNLKCCSFVKFGVAFFPVIAALGSYVFVYKKNIKKHRDKNFDSLPFYFVMNNIFHNLHLNQ